MEITLADAVSYIHPNSEYVIYGDTLEGLVFIKPDNLTVTQDQVTDAIVAVKKDRELKAKTSREAKAALLERLGITEAEAQLLLA
jgi:hypothetical protein